MTVNNTMEIVAKFVELLTPLPTEERQRVIGAALVLLGENPPSLQRVGADGSGFANEDVNLPQRAQVWLKQNQLTMDTIEEVFHITGSDVDVIAHDMPGKNNKEKTLNAYLLTGIKQLLATGEASFEDKQARALCKSSGCYSEANHATYLKGKGNEMNGSKEKGWVLTAPGLKRSATLIKEAAPN